MRSIINYIKSRAIKNHRKPVTEYQLDVLASMIAEYLDNKYNNEFNFDGAYDMRDELASQLIQGNSADPDIICDIIKEFITDEYSSVVTKKVDFNDLLKFIEQIDINSIE